jgi:drug/metabolite transporter (DMT)-like permease
MERKDLLAGYLLAAASAVTFSIKGIFAKLIYGYGLDPVTLLALRFAIAMPFFWAAVFFFPSPRVSWRDFLYLTLSGFLGLYAAALADFYGLLYIDASLERVILYTYPAMVAVLAAVFFKERLTRAKAASLVLTYAGLALVLKVYGGIEPGYALGAGLVLFSALIYSFSYILTQVLSTRVSGVKIAAYGTTAAAVAFLATWRGQSFPEEPEVWALLVALAVVSTFVPVLTLALGIRRIGASRAALVSFIGPVSTAVLAYFILGEELDLVQVAGMAVVIAGVLVVSFEGRQAGV